jgi:hypothetical protein
MNKITLWALESDYDAEAVCVIADKILSENGVSANIQAHGKPKRAIAKKGAKGLKDAVKNLVIVFLKTQEV